jgi:hypothetical protein
LYHCGHGETAPLRGLFSSLTWAASVSPEAASFVTASTARAERVTQLWAAVSSFQDSNGRLADDPSVPPKPRRDRAYWMIAGGWPPRLLDLRAIVPPHGAGVAPPSAPKTHSSVLIGATKHDQRDDNPGAGDLKLTAVEISTRDAATSAVAHLS